MFALIKEHSNFPGLNGKITILPLILILFFLLYNCAKVGTPSGGDVDETPPKIIESTPDNYSINVQSTAFEITFDEYIKLKEVNQKLLISPPLENRPSIRVKNKSLIIELDEELKQNTTYTFNFFDAIVDNNEDNPYENFEFVFSTGENLDSLSISGNVIRAFDLKTEENVTIILHNSSQDSAFNKIIPEYVSKADEEGNFRINNIKTDTFRLYALKDANMNYMYDQPGEMIAFLDTPVIFSDHNHVHLKMSETDTLEQAEKPANIQNLELFLFNEEKREQYLKSSERTNPRYLMFVFNEPLVSPIPINLVDTLTGKDWYQKEEYLVGDTIGFWIKDTVISNQTALKVEYAYQKNDSTGKLVEIRDTATFRYSKPTSARTRRRTETAETKTEPKITLTANISRGKPFDLNQDIRLETSTPVGQIDTSGIVLVETEDSTKTPLEFNLRKRKKGNRTYFISKNWKESKPYKLTLLPGAFVDIYGITHDTVVYQMETQSLDYYGAIIPTVSNTNGHVVVQLIDSKEEVIKETIVKSDTTWEYRYLYPGQYMLKAIMDSNKNGKWDTGDFSNKIQPEEVLFYEAEIQIRSNWDYEVEWVLKTKRKQ